jgi:hypothetical protein
MHQQQLLQEPKLTDRDIRTPRRLQALNTRDANADMSGLDHGDVVGAVSDREEDRFQVLFDEFDDEGFLEGGDATCGRLRDERVSVGRKGTEERGRTNSRRRPCT